MSPHRGNRVNQTKTSSLGAAKRSGPIVAWAKEKPISRWIDILYLAERLAPKPSLIPADAAQRALMIGLSMKSAAKWVSAGIVGYSSLRRPTLPEILRRASAAMGGKYGYNEGAAKAAGEHIAGSLKALSTQLKSQYARGVNYFIGDCLSALDIYWTAFANLLDPLPKEQCPMPDAYRPGFTVSDPVVKAALDPLLLEHRIANFSRALPQPNGALI